MYEYSAVANILMPRRMVSRLGNSACRFVTIIMQRINLVSRLPIISGTLNLVFGLNHVISSRYHVAVRGYAGVFPRVGSIGIDHC